jgi:hypothetical protein
MPGQTRVSLLVDGLRPEILALHIEKFPHAACLARYGRYK